MLIVNMGFVETGSTWNPVNGLAASGPLAGKALRPVPYVPAYDEAWLDFFPQTEMYSRNQ